MQRFRSFVALIFLALILLTHYQNCGDISLKTPDVNNSVSLESVEPTYLKAPETEIKNYRLVFFIDMSSSMTTTNCVNGVDSWLSDLIPTGDCSAPNGIDATMNRLKVVKSWLSGIKQNLGSLQEENIKVLLTPFSRESFFKHSNYFTGPNSPLYTREFVSLDDALRGTEELIGIHECFYTDISQSSCDDLLAVPEIHFDNGFTRRWAKENSQNTISTSVPGPAIKDMNEIIQSEIDSLSDQQRATTHFEVSFLSDGNPTPRKEHIVKLVEELWKKKEDAGCVSACTNSLKLYLHDPTHPDIDPVCIGDNGCINKFRCDYKLETDVEAFNNTNFTGGGGYPGYCENNFERIKTFWGDYRENRMETILSKIYDVGVTFKTNSELGFRFNFILVNSKEETGFSLVDFLKEKKRNWIKTAQERYRGQHHRAATIKESIVPFPLLPALSDTKSYRIEDIFITNLNLKNLLPNKTTTDSSGNGLNDTGASENNFDVQVVRSNGVCLDIITKNQGCISEFCRIDVDRDGDGLNQCEERTLGLSDIDFDSDGDNIPDLIEVLNGYNPLKNDYDMDSNNDGISNVLNFKMGLPPLASYNMFTEKELISYKADFVGYEWRSNSDGDEVLVAGYKIAFKTPLLPTKEVRNNNDNFFIGRDQNEGTNTVLILAKIINNQNSSDYYWVGKKLLLDKANANQLLKIDLSELEKLNVLDPNWEIY